MLYIAIGEYYDNQYGQRFVVTGSSLDLDTWEERIEFYDVNERDQWNKKWSEPYDRFVAKLHSGELKHHATE